MQLFGNKKRQFGRLDHFPHFAAKSVKYIDIFQIDFSESGRVVGVFFIADLRQNF